MSQPSNHRSARALLISPDEAVAADFSRLLARELPELALSGLRAYPSRAAHPECFGPGDRFCFLDVSSDEAAAFGVLSLLGACHPGLPVIALLRANDPDLILRCLRQGAIEFLIHPFTPDQLHAALAKLSRFHPPPRPPLAGQGGRVFCLMPTKGACGATTVAANLAHALKRLSKRALLADLDGLTGTTSFLLKLKSNYSFVDALAHADNLDADLWRALVIPSAGIDVLLSPEDPVDTLEGTADPGALLAYARQAYDTVTVDLGGAYGDWNLGLARLCDELLLVTTNELPALHAAQRAMVYLEENGVERSRMRLLVNRYPEEAGIRAEDIETALRAEVFHTLPIDCEAVQRALMEGKAAPPSSRFGKSLAALAQRLCGEEEPAAKSSKLGGLFSRRK